MRRLVVWYPAGSPIELACRYKGAHEPHDRAAAHRRHCGCRSAQRTASLRKPGWSGRN